MTRALGRLGARVGVEQNDFSPFGGFVCSDDIAEVFVPIGVVKTGAEDIDLQAAAPREVPDASEISKVEPHLLRNRPLLTFRFQVRPIVQHRGSKERYLDDLSSTVVASEMDQGAPLDQVALVAIPGILHSSRLYSCVRLPKITDDVAAVRLM